MKIIQIVITNLGKSILFFLLLGLFACDSKTNNCTQGTPEINLECQLQAYITSIADADVEKTFSLMYPPAIELLYDRYPNAMDIDDLKEKFRNEADKLSRGVCNIKATIGKKIASVSKDKILVSVFSYIINSDCDSSLIIYYSKAASISVDSGANWKFFDISKPKDKKLKSIFLTIIDSISVNALLSDLLEKKDSLCPPKIKFYRPKSAIEDSICKQFIDYTKAMICGNGKLAIEYIYPATFDYGKETGQGNTVEDIKDELVKVFSADSSHSKWLDQRMNVEFLWIRKISGVNNTLMYFIDEGMTVSDDDFFLMTYDRCLAISIDGGTNFKFAQVNLDDTPFILEKEFTDDVIKEVIKLTKEPLYKPVYY